jgi:hypothetical protein
MGIQAGILLMHLLTDPLCREIPAWPMPFNGPDVSAPDLSPVCTLWGLNVVVHMKEFNLNYLTQTGQ